MLRMRQLLLLAFVLVTAQVPLLASDLKETRAKILGELIKYCKVNEEISFSDLEGNKAALYKQIGELMEIVKLDGSESDDVSLNLLVSYANIEYGDYQIGMEFYRVTRQFPFSISESFLAMKKMEKVKDSDLEKFIVTVLLNDNSNAMLSEFLGNLEYEKSYSSTHFVALTSMILEAPTVALLASYPFMRGNLLTSFDSDKLSVKTEELFLKSKDSGLGERYNVYQWYFEEVLLKVGAADDFRRNTLSFSDKWKFVQEREKK